MHASPKRQPAILVSGSAGLAAGIALLGVWYLLYSLRLSPFPPFDLTDLIIRYTPGSLATWAIESLEHLAQPVLHIASLLGFVLLFGCGGLVLARRPSRRAGVAFGMLLLPFVLALSWWSADGLSVGRLIWLVLAFGSSLAIAGAAAAAWISRFAADEQARLEAESRNADWLSQPGTHTRREIIRSMLSTALIAGVGGTFGGLLLRRSGVIEVPTLEGTPLEAVRTAAATTGLPNVVAPAIPASLPPVPEPLDLPNDARARITSNSNFYVIDISFRKPVLPENEWTLRVHGLVEREVVLTYADLLAAPAIELDGTLMCISYTHDNDLISSTRWTGVRLRHILQRSGILDGVIDVVCRGTNNYSDSIRLRDALSATTILAYGMNGTTLPREHGFPCRLYVPELYGEKNVKWLREIELVDYDYQGYWQERGWTDIAIVNTVSAIDSPRGQVSRALGGVVDITGIAHAGTRGIQTVEVQVDDGPWQRADVEPYEPALLWQRWVLRWQADPGSHTLTVRAVDGEGTPQDTEERSPHPDGMTGLHSVQVVVS